MRCKRCEGTRHKTTPAFTKGYIYGESYDWIPLLRPNGDCLCESLQCDSATCQCEQGNPLACWVPHYPISKAQSGNSDGRLLPAAWWDSLGSLCCLSSSVSREFMWHVERNGVKILRLKYRGKMDDDRKCAGEIETKADWNKDGARWEENRIQGSKWT